MPICNGCQAETGLSAKSDANVWENELSWFLCARRIAGIVILQPYPHAAFFGAELNAPAVLSAAIFASS